jgi:hypothetical protein
MMRAARFALALMAAVCAGPGFAREITSAEKASLGQTVSDFSAATRANNMGLALGYSLSPRLMEAMAQSAGITADQLRKAVVEASRQTMALVTIHSFGLDMPTARYLELPNGTPYALIPTKTVMEAGGVKVEQSSDTLGLLDGGKWYLIRVADVEQAGILVKVYPEFSGISFGAETSKVIR